MNKQRGAGTISYSQAKLKNFNLIIFLAEARRAHNPEDARSKLAVATFLVFVFFLSFHIRSNNALRRGYVFCKCFWKFRSKIETCRCYIFGFRIFFCLSISEVTTLYDEAMFSASVFGNFGAAGARVALLWASK